LLSLITAAIGWPVEDTFDEEGFSPPVLSSSCKYEKISARRQI
jgi:hypothetical protein